MKRVLCLLLALSCCLSLAACASTAPAPAGGEGSAVPETVSATFPPEYLDLGAEAAPAEELVSECSDLAASGEYVWRYTYGKILCEDPKTGETAAFLPAGELLRAGEKAVYQSVLSWTEDSVLLVLFTETGTEKHVELVKLEVRDGEICVLDRQTADSSLGFLTAEADRWLEINMVSNGERIFIAALDPGFLFHLYLYTPAGDELRELGTRSLDVTVAALAYGADMLMVGPNQEDEGVLELTRLSLTDGSTALLEAIPVDSALELFNFAYAASDDLLLYTCNNVVYAYQLYSGQPPKAIAALEAVPAFFRAGMTAGGRYVCHGEVGQLLSCDIHGELDVRRLRIISAEGDETLAGAVRDFGVTDPRYSVSLVMCENEEDMLERLRSGEEVFDAFVVSLDSDVWHTLLDGGMTAEITGSSLVDAVTAAMPDRMRAALAGDAGLKAFPIRADNYCQLLNVPAAMELSGLAEDKLPTDWSGFLKFLGQLAKKGVLIDNSQYCVFNPEVSAWEFRDIVFNWLMQDCFLWVRANNSRHAGLEKTLVPLLKEFNRIDWTRLGLPEDIGEGAFSGIGAGFAAEDKSGGGSLSSFDPAAGVFDTDADRRTEAPAQRADMRTALLTETFVEIGVIAKADGDVYWPLSFETGGEKLITQNLLALCVSADAPDPEAVRTFIEYVWSKMDMPMKMTLCRTINEPTANPYYEEDLAYYEKTLESLEKTAIREKNPVEKEILNQQLRQMHAFADQYRKNAYWAASAESITAYRALEDRMVPSPVMLWIDPSIDDAMYDFLDGLLTPRQLAGTLKALMTP